MRITMEKIKAEYPRPKAKDTDGGYCVLGALALYLDLRELRFPHEGDAARMLMDVNPDLTHDQAFLCAERIIGLNDDRHYKAAWEELDAALKFTKKNYFETRRKLRNAIRARGAGIIRKAAIEV